jgi:hypothetical protein
MVSSPVSMVFRNPNLPRVETFFIYHLAESKGQGILFIYLSPNENEFLVDSENIGNSYIRNCIQKGHVQIILFEPGTDLPLHRILYPHTEYTNDLPTYIEYQAIDGRVPELFFESFVDTDGEFCIYTPFDLWD